MGPRGSHTQSLKENERMAQTIRECFDVNKYMKTVKTYQIL